MHGDGQLRPHPLDRCGGRARTHGEAVTDGDQQAVDFPLLAHGPEIAQQPGIAHVVDRRARLDDEAGSDTAGRAVGERRRVACRELRQRGVADVDGAADVHGLGAEAARVEPVGHLEGADDDCVVGAGDGLGVADVVVMRMGQRHDFASHIGRGDGRMRVVAQKGVDTDAVASRQQERGVAVPGQAHGAPALRALKRFGSDVELAPETLVAVANGHLGDARHLGHETLAAPFVGEPAC